MKPSEEREVAAAIKDARRAGVPEAAIDRVVRRKLALGGEDDPFLWIAIAGTLANMAHEARRER